MNLFRVGFYCALLGIGIFCVSSCERAGESPKKVVLYCSVDQAVAEPIIALFEEQSGIKVLARFDTEASKTVGLVQKIRAEAANPNADVFWSSEIFYTIRLGREGLLEPFVSDEFADWPATFVDNEKKWYAFGLRGRVIAYNTSRVSAAEAPASLEEVLEGKWKDRVVMARPQFGTTGGDVASWFAHLGAEKAEGILQSLKDNKVRIVDGNSTAVRMVAMGQADLCFTDTDDVYAGRRNDWPVEMKMLERGGEGTLTIPNTAAIIKGARNRKNAERLMQFLLGGLVEKMLLESDSHNWPVEPGKFDFINKFSEFEISKPLKIDYEDITDNLELALKKAGEVFD